MSFIICSLQTSRFNKVILVALLHNSNDVELLRLSSYSIVGMEGHLFKEYIRSGSKKGSKGSGDTEEDAESKARRRRMNITLILETPDLISSACAMVLL